MQKGTKGLKCHAITKIILKLFNNRNLGTIEFIEEDMATMNLLKMFSCNPKALLETSCISIYQKGKYYQASEGIFL
jgi:hypothetical protein